MILFHKEGSCIQKLCSDNYINKKIGIKLTESKNVGRPNVIRWWRLENNHFTSSKVKTISVYKSKIIGTSLTREKWIYHSPGRLSYYCSRELCTSSAYPYMFTWCTCGCSTALNRDAVFSSTKSLASYQLWTETTKRQPTMQHACSKE